MTSTNTVWIHSIVAACICCAAVGTATAATISYVGVDYDIEDHANTPTTGWLNPTPVKPLDIDGDNILGTDGYEVYFTKRLQPTYLLPMSNVYVNRNNSSVLIDNTADPSGADVTAGFYHDGGAGLGVMSAPLLRFVISGSDLDGKTLRVGVLVDIGADTNAVATYTVVQTNGSLASATSDTLTTGNLTLDVVYFDINDAVDGDAFVIKATTISGSPLEQVVGVTFDTAAAGIALDPPDGNVSTNAIPGTLVGALSYQDADEFVLSGAASSKYQITGTNQLRTAQFMNAASDAITVTANSNGTQLVSTDFTINVTPAVGSDWVFVVSAEVGSGAADGTLIGTAQTLQSGATFSISAGRDDLFYMDGADLKLTNSAEWGGVGTTNYVTLQAAGGSVTNELVVAASVVNTAPTGTLFIFR